MDTSQSEDSRVRVASDGRVDAPGSRENGPSRLRVEVVGDDDASREAYASLVADHDASTAFHTLAWRRAVRAAFGYEPRFRLVRDRQGEPVAAVPGFRVPEPIGSSVANPFCEYGYPLVSADADVGLPAILRRLASTVDSLGALVLKESPLSGVRGYDPAGYGGVETGHTVRLSVDLAFDRLWEDVFDAEIRRNVRRARRRGVTVEASDDVEAFHRLYVDTMRRLGSPQFPRSFVTALSRSFDDAFDLRLATLDGEPVAGLVSLRHDGTRHLLLNGSDRDAEGARPNYALYVDCVERACRSGLSVVDFGRTEAGSGVHDFKRQFGGTEYPLVSFVAPPGRTSRADVSGLKTLAPLTRAFAPVITHPAVGPTLKRFVHE
jgi:CelD/BcsL family acetyltransferase involved in cellulose biosynthesis